MFIFGGPPLLWAEPMRRMDCNPSLSFKYFVTFFLVFMMVDCIRVSLLPMEQRDVWTCGWFVARPNFLIGRNPTSGDQCPDIQWWHGSDSYHILLPVDSQRIPSAVVTCLVTCMMKPRWRRQPGKRRGISITESMFLDILDGLTAANAVQLEFFENRSLSEVLNVKWEEWTSFF